MKLRVDRERVRPERGERPLEREWLCVTPTRGESVDAGLLRWLTARRRRYLLAAAPDGNGGVRYDTTGLLSLHDFLRQQELTPVRYENLLVSTCGAMATCVADGAPLRALVFDDEAAFADESGELNFCFFPTRVTSKPSRRNDPKSFLKKLCRRGHLCQLEAEDLLVADELERLLAPRGDISLRALEDFLLDKYGVDVAREVAPHAARPAARTPEPENRVAKTLLAKSLWEAVPGFEPEPAMPDPEPKPAVLPPEPFEPEPFEAEPLEPESFAPEPESFATEPEPSEDAAPRGTDPASDDWSEEEPWEVTDQRDEADLTEAPAWAFDPEPGLKERVEDQPQDQPVHAPVRKHFLLVDEEANEAFDLGDAKLALIGRGSGNDVQIPYQLSISREHARVEKTADGFRITDLGSANGTTVQGHELQSGDSAEVALGESFLLADASFRIERA